MFHEIAPTIWVMVEGNTKEEQYLQKMYSQTSNIRKVPLLQGNNGLIPALYPVWFPKKRQFCYKYQLALNLVMIIYMY